MATSKSGVRITNNTLIGMLTIYRAELEPVIADAVEETGDRAAEIMARKVLSETTPTGRKAVSLGQRKYRGRVRKDLNTPGSIYESFMDSATGEHHDAVRIRRLRTGNVNAEFGMFDAPYYAKYQEYGTSTTGWGGRGIKGMFAYSAGWAYFSSRLMIVISERLKELGEDASAARMSANALRQAEKGRHIPSSYRSR